jgi:heat shock protein HslJ
VTRPNRPVRPTGTALLVVVAVALTALIAGACGDDDVSSSSTTTGGSSAGSLAGTNWVLTPAAEGGSAPALDFDTTGHVSGSTGCNRFAGSYTQDGSGLRVELGPVTKVACTAPAVEAQETKILGALPKVRGSKVSGDTLTLTGSGGATLLTYERVSSDLAGTSWRVLGVNENDAVVTSALTERLTADFGADGTISGNGGCNTFRGTYRVDGDAITISDLASTMMGCEQDVMATEQAYLAALQRATRSSVSGTTLELRDDRGALQVSLRSAP